ncbi:MAG TPA: hypothetical protein VKB78_10120 [Pirellulales bacterium]|nr:hypothetical protein [Pirellulales bacterium]
MIISTCSGSEPADGFTGVVFAAVADLSASIEGEVAAEDVAADDVAADEVTADEVSAATLLARSGVAAFALTQNEK